MRRTNPSRRARSIGILSAVLAVASLATGVLVATPGPAGAADVVRPIRFPVFGGASFVDTFGAPRSGGRTHEGQDLFAPKMRILIATVSGTVTSIQRTDSGLSGNKIVIQDADGWRYVYIHVNNDTPGTDDGANRDLEMFLPGLYVGAKVYSGQALGFLGDSGNAETTPSHLHFEIRDPSNVAVNAYASLVAADRSTPDPSVWAAGMPGGNLEALALAPGGVTVSGWAHDDDGTGSAAETYVDGYLRGVVATGGLRSDVAAVRGPTAATSGFSGSVPAGAGTHQVCSWARNVGRGPATAIGCRGISIPSLPIGNFDGVSVDGVTGAATVQGWALDAQTAAPVPIHVYVNGQFAGWTYASTSRPDVGGLFPAFGSYHGFAATVSAPRGDSTACVYAIDDANPDRNRWLGCQTVHVPTGPPFGTVDSAIRVPGGVVLQGWAIDPDTTAPIEVDVWEAGTFAGWGTASLSRPDVGAAFPGYGDAHGYSVFVPAGAGQHRYCAYGIGVPAGANSQLGCRDIQVGNSPVGNLDAVSRAAAVVTTSGWALDPDVLDAVQVVLYVDGQVVASSPTMWGRSDVNAAWPAYGGNRGFVLAAAVTPGPHQVCAVAANIGPGADRLLGCQSV